MQRGILSIFVFFLLFSLGCIHYETYGRPVTITRMVSPSSNYKFGTYSWHVLSDGKLSSDAQRVAKMAEQFRNDSAALPGVAQNAELFRQRAQAFYEQVLTSDNDTSLQESYFQTVEAFTALGKVLGVVDKSMSDHLKQEWNDVDFSMMNLDLHFRDRDEFSTTTVILRPGYWGPTWWGYRAWPHYHWGHTYNHRRGGEWPGVGFHDRHDGGGRYRR